MKYVIAIDAILRGHVTPTDYEGIFFWRKGDGFLLTRNVAVAQQFDTRKEAEDTIKSDNVASDVGSPMQIRGNIFVLELEERELFKLALKYPNVNIGLD